MATKAETIFPTTAAAVRALLAARYCQPEWAIFFEVAAATGGGTRSADAVAMNLWHSRGLALNGFEIKVSRADFLKEIKDPSKAESIAQHCDFWWLVAAKGIVREGELPLTWGLIEVNERGLTTKVQAKLRETGKPAHIPRQFVAALMRRCGQLDEHTRRELIAKETAAIRANEKRWAEERFEQAQCVHEELAARVAAFEAASGISLSRRYADGDQLGRSVKLVEKLGLTTQWGGLAGLRNTLAAGAKQMTAMVEAIDAEVPKVDDADEDS